ARVLRPGIEAEARDRQCGGRPVATQEHRAEVARPATVGWESEELDASAPEIDAHPLQYAPGLTLVGGGVDEDARDLARRELAHDLAVHPLDRRDLSRPVAPVVWPAEPRGLVRLPLGGHAKAEGGGSLGGRHSGNGKGETGNGAGKRRSGWLVQKPAAEAGVG